MVSASHNPKEWNGFKLVRPKGVPVSGETGLGFLKEKVATNRFLPAKTPGTTIKNETVLTDYINYCLSFADLNRIKPLKIAVDTANGMGATYLEPLFGKLPLTLAKINFQLDGSFPAHEADPLNEANLAQLKALIKTQGADLGIATDGDGDRLFFLDDKGEVINPAIIRGFLAQLFLKDKPGAKIGYDVRPGKVTEDMILAAGGQPVITRVGHSLIKEQMLKEDIYFAGESSGHFYLNAPLGCFEYPPIIILKLLAALSESGQAASAYISPLNKYFSSGEINRVVKDPAAVLKIILGKYRDGQINQLDGVSVAYPDYWFNVRAANTEPKIRLNLEATSRALMEKKRDEVLNLIN
jgi:phosphomannomutase